MNILESLSVIVLAGLIHASLQLSISMLTLLSGHAIGKKTSHARLISLTGGFTAGAIVMTMLVVTLFAFVGSTLLRPVALPLVWAGASGLAIGLAVAVWIFYYRKERGTALWVPRNFARYLSERTKATQHATEAFSLGLTSILAELVFIIAPSCIAALSILQLPRAWQVGGIILYTAIASSSLLIVYALVGSGHKLSRIQRWREDNKLYLQFIAGSALAVLGFYIYVNNVIAPTVVMRGGL